MVLYQKHAAKALSPHPWFRNWLEVRKTLYTHWEGTFMEHTTKKLTKRSNRIPAFLRMRRSMERSLDGRFIGGIWEGEHFVTVSAGESHLQNKGMKNTHHGLGLR
ncbi:hypothetical protein K469DRAFT_713489 [Zopfia rhizophila CBS 207.26]|uniref:Uncharacterized protein n=1 Tax=Zopfia rhizophila CBS 207.26 TaxID=1314779 RepID=A0A6A6DW30_9PEZI|nr:hypothetical protein K469DRAFT_713489 [Zopfia rhizophila CBS 207.26]